MKRKILIIILILCLLMNTLESFAFNIESVPKSNTDWFSKAQYGIFVHYLEQFQNNADSELSQGQSTSWDDCVNAFNVNTFANNMEQAGAGYVIFTVMQLSKYMIAPNATYNSYTGYAPGEACSQRDLINDLYFALNAKNIKLMLYFTGDGPSNDSQASQGLGIDGTANATFRSRWYSVVKEYSDRYGSKISGWWVDGCFIGGYNDYTLSDFSKAIKSGNPDSTVSFSGGLGDIRFYSSSDDYTAGERNSFDQYPSTRFIKGKQWQCLSFMGTNWGSTNSKYSSSQLINYVNACNSKNGVVTIDVGLYRNGSISSTQMNILTALKNSKQSSTYHANDNKYITLFNSIRQNSVDRPVFEVVQKFESIQEKQNCGTTYGGDIDTIVTGNNSLSGNSSLSTFCNTNSWR